MSGFFLYLQLTKNGIMKKIILLLLLVSGFVNAQGASISRVKKSKEPIVLYTKDTLKVGSIIKLNEGSIPDGTFKYVQLLNNFNEPIQLANSRAAFTQQKIKFFKEQNGLIYVFTDFFCINIEYALKNKEVEKIN